MKREEFCQVLGDINENHIKNARADRKVKKNLLVKWGVRAAACFAIVAILGAGMFQSGLLGERTDTAVLDNGDKIIFAKSEAGASSIDIDGTITTKQLTKEETAALFPNLSVTAHAVFMTRDMETDHSQELIGLEGNIGNVKMTVSTSDVQLLDTVIEGIEETAEINGIDIAAGYFVTDPNSKGKQNVVYYAAFEIGNCKVYLENGGTKDESEAIKNQLVEVIQKITENGELDFTSVIDNEIDTDLSRNSNE